MQCDPFDTRNMRARSGGNGRIGTRVWLPLLSELMAMAQGHGELLVHSERPWASATFSGARHVVSLQFSGEEAVAAGEHFMAGLEEHEFNLPGALVADASVTAVDHVVVPSPRLTVTAEFLLIDEE